MQLLFSRMLAAKAASMRSQASTLLSHNPGSAGSSYRDGTYFARRDVFSYEILFIFLANHLNGSPF